MLKDFKDYKFKSANSRKDLSKELSKLQRRMLNSEKQMSMIIMLDGWESSGRGEVMLDIMRELDHRFIDAVSIEDWNLQWPFLKPLWDNLPKYGDGTIFSRSVYKPLFHSLGLSEDTLNSYIETYESAERALYKDNTIIVKIFLDVSKETQKNRIAEFYADPYKRLYVGPEDVREHSRYEAMRAHYDNVLKKSNFPFSPWHVISAENLRDAGEQALSIINKQVSEGIDRIEGTLEEVSRTYKEKDFVLDKTPTLVKMDKKDYRDQLEDLQEKAASLQLCLKARGIPTVMAFEGTDAAGKGGSIKRLYRLMDPRFAVVSTTASPTASESAHHYLWRFYQEFPRYGNITIFDRSWYGRVLVERVEGFARPYEWERAYEEINAMEKGLWTHNCLILKYYIHIDKDEQKNRFTERINNPNKNYKITDEDWRNRDKWELYWEAANEMIVRTSTKYAPWQIVSGNCKEYARIFILKDFIRRAEEALTTIRPWAGLSLVSDTL